MTSAPPTRVDIAIVGGGMVGVSLALLLGRQQPGWRVALIESRPLPAAGEPIYQSSFDARSTALALGSREILQRGGVWDALAAHVTPMTTVHVSDRGHFGGLALTAAEHGVEALGYVVENAWLGRVLASRLATTSPVTALAPAAVTSLRPRAAGFELQLAGDDAPAVLQADLVVLADGAQSSLRNQLGISTRDEDYDQSAIVANVVFDQPNRGVAYERFTEQGPLALLPMGPRQSALIWTVPRAQADTLLAASDAEFISLLQLRFGHRLGRALRVSRRHGYPLHLTVAREQVRRGLVLMGNAAHSLHPVAGQGFNLALRDAAGLASRLADAARRGLAIGDLAVLEDYAARRCADQTATIRLSDGLVRLFSSANTAFSVFRQLGLFGLELATPAKTALARQTMGMSQ